MPILWPFKGATLGPQLLTFNAGGVTPAVTYVDLGSNTISGYYYFSTEYVPGNRISMGPNDLAYAVLYGGGSTNTLFSVQGSEIGLGGLEFALPDFATDSVAVSPDGAYIYANHYGTLEVYTAAGVLTESIVLDSYVDAAIVQILPSPDGQWVYCLVANPANVAVTASFDFYPTTLYAVGAAANTEYPNSVVYQKEFAGFSTEGLGSKPMAITADGAYVYLTTLAGEVFVLSVPDITLAGLMGRADPFISLTSLDGKSFYVLDYYNYTITKFSSTTFDIITTIFGPAAFGTFATAPSPTPFNGWALSPDGNYLMVATWGYATSNPTSTAGNTVIFINTTTLETVATVSVPALNTSLPTAGSGITGCLVCDESGYVYVTSQQYITKIEIATQTIVNQTAILSGPAWAAMNGQGNGNFTCSVMAYPSGGDPVLYVGTDSYDFALNQYPFPFGTLVVAYDTITYDLSYVFISNDPYDQNCQQLIASPDGKYIFVGGAAGATFQSNLVAIATASNTVVEGWTFSDEFSNVTMALTYSGEASAPANQFLYFSTQSDIYVLNVGSGTFSYPIATIPTAGGTTQLIVSPNGQTIYANSGEVVEVATNAVVGTVPYGTTAAISVDGSMIYGPQSGVATATGAAQPYDYMMGPGNFFTNPTTVGITPAGYVCIGDTGINLWVLTPEEPDPGVDWTVLGVVSLGTLGTGTPPDRPLAVLCTNLNAYVLGAADVGIVSLTDPPVLVTTVNTLPTSGNESFVANSDFCMSPVGG
jgi:hypothetical protein